MAASDASSSRPLSRARPPFQYLPLRDDQSIRILTLEPGSGANPLVGSLGTEQLGSRPEYEAISYVWGTGGRHSELVCDGAALPLTQSIYDALCRVRHATETRRLWADQICINQDDIPERSQQVKLMNAVYKNARRVLVWLGRDLDGVARDAVSMIHRLNDVFGDEEAHRAFRVEHSENLAKQTKEPWIPISKLTKLPWFHRIWIVQEIGTDAPAILYWGDAEVDWETLSSVAAVLNQNYHHLRSRFYIGTPNVRYLHKRFVEPDVEHYDQYHNRGCFVYELHRARHLLAQDPRDHIYAFLGHFSLNTGGQGLASLVADYSQPVEEVYMDVARRALQGADSLIMLSANHNHPPSNKRRRPLPPLPLHPPTEWLANGAAYLLRSSPNPQDLDISADLRALAHAGDPYQWTREATLVTRYRRFAVTARGYYVLGPDALQVGDVVVVLHGGRTPFILRRAEDGGPGWTLIGECYAHGLMNGEALDLQGAVEDVFSIS
ncbi:Heterokaryon incompatibility 6-like protein [Cladobotryum mycophilum]|uniref:Heterokaryon incompatibility 6-like protein n=1 Tax=Cladobotryum mycophilum TaxID=491253 RepID=A0ABR0T0Y2_9HYPO